MRRRGHRVWIAGSQGRGLNPALDSCFADLPLKELSGGRLYSRSGAAALWRSVRGLRRLIVQHRIAVVHAHETAPAVVARLATAGLRVPVVFSCHGGPDAHYRDHARVGRYWAHRVIAVSRNTFERLAALGVPRARIELVPYGIEQLADAEGGDAVRALRQQLLGPGRRRLVVSVARLHPQKGIDILIEAAREVVKALPEAVFVVVGGGPDEGQARALIRRASLQEHFQLVGEQENPRRFLAAADLFVLASRWEALPLSIPEAYRMGLPVVATDVGGVAEIVDEEVGRVVAPEDPRALAGALLELLRDDGRRAAMSATARRYGQQQRYDPDQIYPDLERVYRELIRLRL
jgi:glycosyltransferase involved in cell wall biosynthesis